MSPLAAFEASWKTSGIVTLPGLSLNECDTSGNGLIRGLCCGQQAMIKDLGTPIVTLPISQCIAVPEAQDGPIPVQLEASVSKEVWRSADLASPTLRLALLLLHEWKEGQNSQYRHYISQLPEPGRFDTPLHWQDEDELAEVGYYYPHLAMLVEKQKERYQSTYSRLVEAKVLNEKHVSFARFVWSLDCVRSRAFNGIGGLSSETSEKTIMLPPVLLLALASASAFSHIGGMEAVVLLFPSVLQNTRGLLYARYCSELFLNLLYSKGW